jgi:uncharacterized membrane protein
MRGQGSFRTVAVGLALTIIGGVVAPGADQPAVIEDLGTLGPGRDVVPYSTNACGQIVGSVSLWVGSDYYSDAFAWQNGVMTPLVVPLGQAWALDINQSGAVVGEADAQALHFSTAVPVKPKTVIPWHREGFRPHWRLRFCKKPGRQSIAAGSALWRRPADGAATARERRLASLIPSPPCAITY